MDREWGAQDALAFVRRTDFAPSAVAFDAAFARGGLMSEVGFVDDGPAPAAAATCTPIGVGMLGYAFMGKAHANAYKTLAYMTWPPPLMPQLVAIAGRNEAAVAEAARRYGFAEHVTDWRALVADERIGLFDNVGPEQPARRADDRRRRGRQARDLREAARARRRRVLRDLAAGRGGRRQAHVRLQLPLRAGRAARARAHRGRRARRDPPLPRRATCRSGARPTPTAWRFDKALAGSGALGDLGAHVDRPRPLPRRRDRGGRGAARRRSSPGREVDDAFEAAVAFASGAVGTIEASRFAPGRKNALPVGDQRLAGLARLRPRAAQRAAVLRGQRGLPHRARLRGRPPVLGALVAAGPHDRLGAHASCTSCITC